MMFGKTTTEKNLLADLWVPWYAWRPVKLDNERTAWLCTVLRNERWNDDRERHVYYAPFEEK